MFAPLAHFMETCRRKSATNAHTTTKRDNLKGMTSKWYSAWQAMHLNQQQGTTVLVL